MVFAVAHVEEGRGAAFAVAAEILGRPKRRGHLHLRHADNAAGRTHLVRACGVVRRFGEDIRQLEAHFQPLLLGQAADQSLYVSLQRIELSFDTRTQGQTQHAFRGLHAEVGPAGGHLDYRAENLSLPPGVLHELRKLRHGVRHRERRVLPQFGVARMRRRTGKEGAEAAGSHLHHAVLQRDGARIEPRRVMQAVDLVHAFRCQDLLGFARADAGLLAVLEQEDDIAGRALLVYLQGECRKPRGMSIVAAFMGDARRLRPPWQVDGLGNGQGVEVRTEGQGRQVRSGAIDGIEVRFASIHYVQPRGIGLEKLDQIMAGPHFPPREFRAGMQFAAQLDRLLVVLFVHDASSAPLRDSLSCAHCNGASPFVRRHRRPCCRARLA